MPAIIVGNDRKILSCFPPGDALDAITLAATESIAASFKHQGMQNPTNDEVKRRFRIVMDAAVELRADHSWGLQRICDTLPEILKTELSGTRWSPASERVCWVPTDGAVLN